MPLEIQLLGGFVVRTEGREVPRPLPTVKAVSLFAFLLLPPGRALPRDHLAEMLWPGSDPQKAAPRLNGTLYYIRRFLETTGPGRERCLVARKTTVHLSPPPDWSVDVWEVEQHLSEADTAPTDALEGRRAREAAVRLYRGALLPELEEEWCRDRRYSLEQRMLDCLHDLTRADRLRGRLAQAAEWALRALAVDECDEVSHRELMQLYAWMGDVRRALRQYEACKRALLTKLDSPPDPETLRLYQWLEHLAQRRGAEVEARAGDPPAAGAPSAPLPGARAPAGEGTKRPGGKAEAPLPGTSRWRAIPTDTAAPLVGREPEMERLRHAWERALHGAGSTLLLAGDAGIGKSRLAREFLQQVERAGGLTLSGRAYALERDFLYQPLMGPLRHAQELIEEQRLSPCPPIWMAQVARLLRELQPEEMDAPAAEESPGLVEGVVQYFLHLARQRPLCLFLDDLQNIDTATESFLRSLCSRVERAPLLLLAAYRHGELARHSWLSERLIDASAAPASPLISLAALSEQQVIDLLQLLSGGSSVPPALLGRHLYKESEGNPLVFWETVRQWSDEGHLALAEDGGWDLRAAWLREIPGIGRARDGRPPPPEAVQAVVRQRLSRLGAPERRLLDCASVIGRRFAFATLQRATEGDSRATLSGLERLLAAALIEAPAEASAYDFRHDKYREVIYSDLMPRQRQQWHRRVGEALEVVYGLAEASEFREDPFPTWSRRPPPPPARARAEEHAAELAYHFRQAAAVVGPEKAAWYHYLAGSRARALCAYEQAEQDLTTAYTLLATSPPDETRLAQLSLIVEQLAPVFRSCRRREEAQRLLEEHIRFCEQHNYPRGIARGCALLGLFFQINPALGGEEVSRSYYERAIALCERYKLDDWVVYPRVRLAALLSSSGDELPRVAELFQESLPKALEIRDIRLLNLLYATRSDVAVMQSDWPRVLETFGETLSWGGLPNYQVGITLETIEERCHRQSTPEAFVALCDALAASYLEAGVEPPLKQWYLAPTQPAPACCESVTRDRFAEGLMDPPFTWLDATGRSLVDFTTRPGWLGLSPAQDADLWPEVNFDAPRLMVTVSGDYAAQVRAEVGEIGSICAGMLLWQDERHFLRLEIHRIGADRLALLLNGSVEGAFANVGRGNLDRGPIWLRVERRHHEVRGLCSTDGERWLTAGSATALKADAEQVGLVAHCQWANAWAWFSEFCLWPLASG